MHSAIRTFHLRVSLLNFFLSFPFVLIFLYFLWLRLLGRGLWCSRDLHSKKKTVKRKLCCMRATSGWLYNKIKEGRFKQFENTSLENIDLLLEPQICV